MGIAFYWTDSCNKRHIFIILAGKIELFSKHDHTQYKLLANVDDHSYNSAVNPIQYISFASFNNTPMDFYYDCSTTPTYIDTQLAIRYAAVGHPLLLEDPTFQSPVDKRNCMLNKLNFFLFLHFNHFLFEVTKSMNI